MRAPAAPKHSWPTAVPLQKAARCCSACGLSAAWVKYRPAQHSDYRWGVSWRRGADTGYAERLRDVPGCESPDVQ